jgi:hypothetical protein
MPSVSMKTSIAAPAAAVWDIVGDFPNPSRYIGAITENTANGTEPGCTRRLILGGETLVVEELKELNQETMTFAYTIIECPLPIYNYHAVMQVTPRGDDACELTWESTFDSDPDSEQDMDDMVRGVYTAGFESIKAQLEA